MTNGNKDKAEQKVDGRKLRRGIRRKYSRKSIEEVDTYERYAMLLMTIMDALEIPAKIHHRLMILTRLHPLLHSYRCDTFRFP